jgi:hypothetical protein
MKGRGEGRRMESLKNLAQAVSESREFLSSVFVVGAFMVSLLKKVDSMAESQKDMAESQKEFYTKMDSKVDAYMNQLIQSTIMLTKGAVYTATISPPAQPGPGYITPAQPGPGYITPAQPGPTPHSLNDSTM